MTKRGIRRAVAGVGVMVLCASLGHAAGPKDKSAGRRSKPAYPVTKSAAPQAKGGAKTASRSPAPPAASRPATDRRVSMQYDGRTYTWYPDRTAIMVDVDGTISTTDYLALAFSSQDRGSRPIKGSVEALTALARDYNIVYITIRSEDAAAKTREWLSRSGFPDGPLVYGPRVSDWTDQVKFKTRRLAQLRETWPNLLIGIGDRSVDMKSFSGNGMLSIVVNKSNPDAYGGRAVVLADWTALAQYFAANRALLTHPTRLAAAIDTNGRLKPQQEAVAAAQ